MEIETPTRKLETPPRNGPHRSPFVTSKLNTESLQDIQAEASINIVHASDTRAELTNVKPEFGNADEDDLAGEVVDWEFDAREDHPKLSS